MDEVTWNFLETYKFDVVFLAKEAFAFSVTLLASIAEMCKVDIWQFTKGVTWY